MNIFRKFKAYLQLRDAVKKADELHAKHGERFYVVNGSDGQLVIMNRKNFRLLKRKHYIDADVTMKDLAMGCFYFTPQRDGQGAIGNAEAILRRMKFYEWKEHSK